MSGQVISRPAREHSCSPGWETKIAPPGSQPFGGGSYSVPPSAYDYPPGTAWQCECGTTWVSLPTIPGSPGVARFRLGRRRERRRREKRAR